MLANKQPFSTPAATLAFALAFCSLWCQVADAQRNNKVLIRLDEQGQLQVLTRDSRTMELAPQSQGLLVWSDGEQEAWEYLPAGATWKQPRSVAERSDALALLHSSRGQGGGSAEGGGQMTVQLVQILGQAVTRGAGFLTPHEGFLLNARITLRRRPQTQPQPYPAAVAVLTSGTKEIARIPFKEGQQKIAYAEIPELVKNSPQGLPPGEYSLRIDGGSETSTFTIEDPEWRAAVMELPNRFAELTGNRTDSLYLQVTAEYLLDQLDEDDKRLAYLSDAFDLLDSIPNKELSAYLRDLKTDIQTRLKGEKPTVADVLDDPTGIAEIDQARRLILSGNWQSALDTIDSTKLPNDPRTKGLATLYRAVILGESGQGADEAAAMSFRQALEELSDADPADRYRAHNNYGNFLLNRTQDRLYNHAFQMAAGVQQPLLAALTSWHDADQQYQAALELTDKLGVNQRAAVQVNVARLYALLADVIRTLDTSVDGSRQFAAGEKAAAASALRFASLPSSGEAVESTVQAAAEEIQAHLAFRGRDAKACREHAAKARAAYLESGSLAGVEGIHRLFGLIDVRAAEFEPQRAVDKARREALHHLSISQELAELLRSRIPVDQFGLSQAGFFARRAYVNEQIIELLVRDGRAVEALRVAEAAKARSLQDLLATRNLSDGEDEDVPRLKEILDDWPADVTAIEYFLGSERAWIFLVDPLGDVTARPLLNVDGTPLRTRELIADVGRFLRDINGMAGKMRDGQGWNDWQEPLHRYYQQLFPPAAIDAARNAKTVVIVPHHILHYLPFAALIVKQDPAELGAMEVPVKARFLVDETFDTCTAPSLATWAVLRQRSASAMQQVNALGIIDFQSAPSLPGVAKDIQNLRDAFGAQVKQVLERDDALESRVKDLLSQQGLLFFATHGHNYASRPLDSYLLCHGDDDNDGQLTSAEIYTTEVRARLVLMSACYTGLADQSPLPGDDLFGLQRAFLQSGACTVISGLWDVYDGTGPILVNQFFQQLKMGRGSAAALANAQRAFLEKERLEGSGNPWIHPYFWAVYNVSGSDHTQFESVPMKDSR